MRVIGKLICLLARLLGGEHQWKRVSVMVATAAGTYPSKTRTCKRCGHTVAVKSRKLKEKA